MNAEYKSIVPYNQVTGTSIQRVWARIQHYGALNASCVRCIKCVCVWMSAKRSRSGMTKEGGCGPTAQGLPQTACHTRENSFSESASAVDRGTVARRPLCFSRRDFVARGAMSQGRLGWQRHCTGRELIASFPFLSFAMDEHIFTHRHIIIK